MPILRIAPICNGKNYVVANHSSSRENNWLDIPIHEHLQTTPSPTGKTALKLKERYHAHIHTSEQPRFCVKYRNKSEHSDTVYLNVLPLEKEEDIHFSHGKFVGIEEIRASYPSFSPNLQEEYEFLGMAAELWNDFYSEL